MRQAQMVQWADPCGPERSQEAVIRLHTVKVGSPVSGWVLSDQVHGVKTHWTNGRTKPCIGLIHACECCLAGMATRLKGYLAVCRDGHFIPFILEVTSKAFEREMGLCMTSGMRGLWFDATRVGKQPNSPLSIRIVHDRQPPRNLPAAPNVPEILCRVWFGRETGRGKTTDVP